MLRRSISTTDAAPTPTASARRRMIGSRRSRWAAESVFESRTPAMRRQFTGMITAAATTGPQVGATPTSSTPATRTMPACQSARSGRSRGTIMAPGRGESNAAYGSSYPPPRGSAGPALAEGGGLADALAQEVELGPAGHAVADDLDLLDARRVDLEGALDADAGAQRAHGDRAGDAAAAQAHDRALEDLDALAVALDDLGRDAHGVAGRKLGQVAADLVRGDLVENVHRALLTGGSWFGVGGRRARDRGSARKYSTGSRTVSPRAAARRPPGVGPDGPAASAPAPAHVASGRPPRGGR